MGIGSNVLSLLLELRRDGHLPLRGAVAEIGAQQLSNTFLDAKDELAQAHALFETGAASPLPPPVSTDLPAHRLTDASPLAGQFWRWIGYDYMSIDVDGSPGSVPLDINYDDIPAKARGRFDLVTNLGTTEHVANQLNAFKIIHELTKPGGLMVHHLPMQGNLNHGLINYHPKFFWMLARSNDYRFLHLSFSADGAQPVHEDLLNHVAEFEPDVREAHGDVNFTDSYLLVVLRKMRDRPYVAALDVGSGAKAANEAMARRYWTVFDRPPPRRLRLYRVR